MPDGPETDLLGSEDNPTRTWIRRTLLALEIDATTLARRSNVAQSSISRFLSGATEALQTRTLSAIAQVSPVAPPETVRKIVDRAPPSAHGSRVSFVSSDHGGLPLWGVHPVEEEGEFRLNPIPLQTLNRPPGSASHKMAAWYAHDDTMSPRWRQGDLVMVDLARPAVEGGFALVRLTPNDGPDRDETFLFRQYLGRGKGYIRLRGCGLEDADASVPLKRVLQTHHILDWRDLVG